MFLQSSLLPRHEVGMMFHDRRHYFISCFESLAYPCCYQINSFCRISHKNNLPRTFCTNKVRNLFSYSLVFFSCFFANFIYSAKYICRIFCIVFVFFINYLLRLKGSGCCIKIHQIWLMTINGKVFFNLITINHINDRVEQIYTSMYISSLSNLTVPSKLVNSIAFPAARIYFMLPGRISFVAATLIFRMNYLLEALNLYIFLQ